MKVVILCGGKGTRIRDVADHIPKPMIPIGNLPILWHIMKYYASWHHQEFILCLGYKGQTIKDFFLNYESHTRDFTLKLGQKNAVEYHDNPNADNWKITMAETGLNSMTGCRIAKIKKYIGDDDDFMLTYGDGLGDIDLKKLEKQHLSHGKIMTITGVRPPGRFGELKADDKGLITEFNEKPQATGGRISGGFFVCNKKIFDYLNFNENLVFEENPMKKLAHDGELHLYKHNGFWQPMDTSREYIYLNNLYQKNTAPWVSW